MSNIKLFQNKKIRSVWNDEEEQWYFVVEDVVAALTDSADPKQYVKRMKQRDAELAKGWVQFVPTLVVPTAGGKQRMSCANVKGLFRIIQSIPSPKAEPFKQWLATVGYERVLEIENPELAQERMKELYEKKGYPKDWIDKRLRGIAIRQNLTDEWKKRGITSESDYAILTAEISKATKKNQNLRDHMDDLELIFTMLGECVTTEISEKEQPDTFAKSKNIARRGGNVAGKAREATEKELGRSVISDKNFLPDSQNPKLEE